MSCHRVMSSLWGCAGSGRRHTRRNFVEPSFHFLPMPRNQGRTTVRCSPLETLKWFSHKICVKYFKKTQCQTSWRVWLLSWWFKPSWKLAHAKASCEHWLILSWSEPGPSWDRVEVGEWWDGLNKVNWTIYSLEAHWISKKNINPPKTVLQLRLVWHLVTKVRDKLQDVVGVVFIFHLRFKIKGLFNLSDRETWAWGTQCGTPNWCILLDKILFQHMPTKQYPRHASFSLMVSPSSRRFKKANRGT